MSTNNHNGIHTYHPLPVTVLQKVKILAIYVSSGIFKTESSIKEKIMTQALLIINSIIMFLFWLAGIIVVTPAYNQFVQYGESGGILPSLTQFIVNFRVFFVCVPIIWLCVSFWIYQILKNRQAEDQLKILLLFSLLSIAVGFSMLIIFGIAAILPYLLIGVAG